MGLMEAMRNWGTQGHAWIQMATLFGGVGSVPLPANAQTAGAREPITESEGDRRQRLTAAVPADKEQSVCLGMVRDMNAVLTTDKTSNEQRGRLRRIVEERKIQVRHELGDKTAGEVAAQHFDRIESVALEPMGPEFLNTILPALFMPTFILMGLSLVEAIDSRNGPRSRYVFAVFSIIGAISFVGSLTCGIVMSCFYSAHGPYSALSSEACSHRRLYER